MIYSYSEGLIQLANVFLSIIAGIIALTLYKKSKGHWRPWKPLIIALILFVVEEILGALRSFRIFSTPYLTHIVPSFVMLALIYALIMQILISRGLIK